MGDITKSTVRHIRGDIFEITDDDGQCYGICVSSQDKASELLKLADGVTPLYVVLTLDDDLVFSKAPRGD